MKRIYSKLTHQKIKAQAERHVQQTEEQIRTEAKFIRQEHRITRILGNFFFNRKEWQSGDPRRIAANRAMLYSWFTVPAPAAAAGILAGIVGTLIAAVTVGLLVWQNMLIQTQIKETDARAQLQRRTELVSILWPVDDPVASPKTRAEALVEFVKIERQKGVSPINLTHADLSNTALNDVDLHECDFSFSKLKDIQWIDVNLVASRFDTVEIDNTKITGNLEKCVFESIRPFTPIKIIFPESVGAYVTPLFDASLIYPVINFSKFWAKSKTTDDDQKFITEAQKHNQQFWQIFLLSDYQGPLKIIPSGQYYREPLDRSAAEKRMRYLDNWYRESDTYSELYSDVSSFYFILSLWQKSELCLLQDRDSIGYSLWISDPNRARELQFSWRAFPSKASNIWYVIPEIDSLQFIGRSRQKKLDQNDD